LGNDSKLALSTGNIGIGTTSPTALLDARITGTTSGAVITVGNVGTGDFGGLAISDGGAYPVQLYGSSLAFLTGNSAYASATEKVRILAGGGITFNGDTAAANALDDYEEGTFTLTFAGESTAGTYTPTDVHATYTKIGRVVTLQYKATFATAASGGSGNMTIGGLPFTYASNNGGMTANIILSDASWGGSYLSMLPTTSGSGTTLIIVETAPSTALTSFVQAGDFNTSTDIRFTLTYQV
jgi:hypothetical protein